MQAGQTIAIKQNASNSDLQRAIEAAIPRAKQQARSFAARYKGRTEEESCKKIFDYLKNNINYLADGPNQAVRLPSGLMRTGQGDCKSYSIFTSAVLSNLGIPHSLCYASYDPKDPTPSHIYVVTDKGCIIDAVYGKFNAEKPPTYKKLKKMNISLISGIKSKYVTLTKSERDRLDYLQKREDYNMLSSSQENEYDTLVKKYRKTKAYTPKIGRSCGYSGIMGTKSGKDWAQSNGLMPYQSELWLSVNNGLFKDYISSKLNAPVAGGRFIFLKLIEKNAGGFANSLYKLRQDSKTAKPSDPAYTKMRDIEIKFLKKGGNPYELYESIDEGNKKTPTGAYFNKLMNMTASGYNPNPAQWIAAAISVLFGKKYNESTGQITGGDIGIGVEPVSTTAATIATAPTWAVLVFGLVGTLGTAYIVAKVGNAQGEGTNTATPPPGGDGSGAGAGSGATGKTLLPILLIGGAAAAYFIFKKKK